MSSKKKMTKPELPQMCVCHFFKCVYVGVVGSDDGVFGVNDAPYFTTTVQNPWSGKIQF